jgi:hypothetical protein
VPVQVRHGPADHVVHRATNVPRQPDASASTSARPILNTTSSATTRSASPEASPHPATNRTTYRPFAFRYCSGQGSGNSRNGTTRSGWAPEVGNLDLATPKDRDGTFGPKLIGKGSGAWTGLADMITSLLSDRAERDQLTPPHGTAADHGAVADEELR